MLTACVCFVWTPGSSNQAGTHTQEHVVEMCMLYRRGLRLQPISSGQLCSEPLVTVVFAFVTSPKGIWAV